jgi:hypothetical protein
VGFWDTYEDLGGNYVKADELEVLMENGIPVTITGVSEEDHPKFGERYVLKLQVPDPESGDESDRLKSFPTGTVDSRDRMLSQMKTYFEDGGEPVSAKFEKSGRAILVRQA